SLATSFSDRILFAGTIPASLLVEINEVRITAKPDGPLSATWLSAVSNYVNYTYNQAHPICFLEYVTGGKMWYNLTIYYGDGSFWSISFVNQSLTATQCHIYGYPGTFRAYFLVFDMSVPRLFSKSPEIDIIIVASPSDCV